MFAKLNANSAFQFFNTRVFFDIFFMVGRKIAIVLFKRILVTDLKSTRDI